MIQDTEECDKIAVPLCVRDNNKTQKNRTLGEFIFIDIVVNIVLPLLIMIGCICSIFFIAKFVCDEIGITTSEPKICQVKIIVLTSFAFGYPPEELVITSTAGMTARFSINEQTSQQVKAVITKFNKQYIFTYKEVKGKNVLLSVFVDPEP